MPTKIFSTGHGKKKSGEGSSSVPSPSRQSGGTSGNLAVKGFKNKTPIVPYAPPSTVAAPSTALAGPPVAQRASIRQRKLVTRYVVKAYTHKLQKQGVPTLEVDQHIAEAKNELSKERDRLLNHPAVQEANANGKIVPIKKLSKLPPSAEVLKPHNQLAYFLAHPARAQKVLGQTSATKQVLKGIRDERNAPSAVEDLMYASIGIPGVGVGGDIAKLAQVGGTAIPKIFAEGAAKRALGSVSTKAAAKAAAIKAAPSSAAEALRGAPSALRGLPRALRAGAPTAAKGAAKAAPRIAGRQVGRAYEASSGLAAVTAAQKAGLPVPGGKQAEAIFKGQAAAVSKDPLKVASSTASILPGLLTGAFQLPVAGVKSAIQGNTGPLKGAIKSQEDFAKHFVETYGSGGAKRIEKATLEEGLLPEILAAPLAGKGLAKLTGHAKPKALEKLQARRAPLTDAEGNVLTHEHGGPVKKGRLRTGKEKQLTRLGERNVQRREEAFHAASMNDLIQLERAKRMEDIHKHARKAAGEQTSVREGLGKKGKDTLQERAPDYLPFLARASIDLHNPEAALREIQHYAEYFKTLKSPREHGVSPEALTARDAVSYFTAHPEKLKDRHLAKALDSYREMANGKAGLRSLSTSDRNRYLGYASMHDILDAKDRVPMGARSHTDATTREGAWADITSRDKQIASLRREGNRKKVEAGAIGKTEKGARLRRESKDAYARAKTIKKGREELHAELKDFTRPGAKANAAAKRIPYDATLEKEMVEEARAGLKKGGLHPEPAYVPDESAVERAAGDQSTTGGKKPLPGGPKINEGYVWQHGLARQGFEHLNNTVLRQVARHHQFEDWKRFKVERGLSFEGVHRLKGKSWQRAFDQGAMSKKDVVLVPTQITNRLEKATQGGDPTEYETALAEAIAATKVSPDDLQPGTTYEAYPRAAYEEKVQQAQRSNVPAALRKANTTTSRMMLSTPSFVGAQLVAETAQAIADVNPARMIQGLRSYGRLPLEARLKLSGVSGEAAGSIFTPQDLQTALGSEHAKPFGDSLGFFRRNVFGRSAKSIATLKWAGQVNRKTGSITRRAVLTGQVARDVNGFVAKGRRLLNLQTDIQKKLDVATKGLRGKAKTDAALQWLAENPRVLDHYEKNLHAAMGGWSNLTRTGHVPESARAAGLIFYPFLRMSLQWPIKYAINHPVKATALAYLAGQNNWALRQALQGEPSFLNYAQVPTWEYNQKGQLVSGRPINLSRVAPGGNALVTAVQGSGSVVGALQPVLAAGLLGATGQGVLGPVEGGVGAHLKAGLASILSLSPYVRAADTLSGQKASGQSEFGVLAERANVAADPLAALETKLKGSIRSQLERSLANPLKPTDLGHTRDSAKLGRILGDLSKYGSSSQSKVQAKSYAEEIPIRKKVIGMQKRYDKAHGELEKLYKKYGLSKVAKRSEEIYYFTHPYPGSTEKKSAYEGTGYKGTGYEGTGYGNKGPGKPPAFPQKSSGANLSLPGLGSALGAVTSPLATLIGGTPAQAAEAKYDPASRKKILLPNIEGLVHPDQKEFAQWFSHYSKVPPKLAGEWVKQEGGGKSSGGEAGVFNQLGVGYPGHQTPFSQSPLFNTSARRAAKATSDWIEGKIGGRYGYKAAPSIQEIARLSKSGAPEAQIRSYIEGPSGWGTGTIAQSGVTVNGKTADVYRGSTPKSVYVRADAKGMVQWAKANLGTQEGSTKQSRWASNEGLGGSEPWCANFVSNGLARRGVALPPNPNYVPSYEHEWKGGRNIGSDISKAKPGDLITFSGQHIGVYVGNGEMVSGNFGNEVSRDPISADSTAVSMILRPNYKGGKVKVQAGAPLSGEMPQTIGGTVLAASPATETPAALTQPAVGKTQRRGMTAAQKLKLVNEITAGNLTRYGIPAFTPKGSVSNLAALGKSLEEGREKLARL